MSIGNVKKLLTYMEGELERAKAIPLTRFIVVDKETLLDLIDRTREILPKEIQEAESIMKRRDEIHRDAQNTAEQILIEAKKEANRRVEEDAILKEVKIQAAKIKDDTNSQREAVISRTVDECMKLKRQVVSEAISIREGADRYAETVINRLVGDVSSLQDIVTNGKSQFAQLKEDSDNKISYYKSILEPQAEPAQKEE